MPLGGAIFLAGPGAAHVLKSEPERAADRGIGPRPLPEGIARGIDAEALRDGPVHDDERRAGMRRRLDGLEVEGRVRHRFDGGEDDRQVLGKRPGHDRIGGDGLDGRPAEPRHDDRDHLVRHSAACPESIAATRARVGGIAGSPSPQPRSISQAWKPSRSSGASTSRAVAPASSAVSAASVVSAREHTVDNGSALAAAAETGMPPKG